MNTQVTTKTKKLDRHIIQGLIHADKITALDCEKLASDIEANVVMASVIFPAPNNEFGRITHALIPNPNWHWWAFWRPRTLLIEIKTEV